MSAPTGRQKMGRNAVGRTVEAWEAVFNLALNLPARVSKTPFTEKGTQQIPRLNPFFGALRLDWWGPQTKQCRQYCVVGVVGEISFPAAASSCPAVGHGSSLGGGLVPLVTHCCGWNFRLGYAAFEDGWVVSVSVGIAAAGTVWLAIFVKRDLIGSNVITQGSRWQSCLMKFICW